MLDNKRPVADQQAAKTTQPQAAHRLHFTIQQAVKNTYSVWLISFFVALAAWRSVPVGITLGWTLMVGVAYAARIGYLRGGCDWGAVEADAALWARRFTVSTLACGAVVALGPVLFFPSASETSRMYMSLLLLAWLSGAMASLGTYPRLYAAYAVLFSGGVGLGWLVSDTAYKVEILVMLCFYAAIVSSFFRDFARVVNEGVEIRFMNERLVAELKAAKEAAKSRFLAVASHDLRQPLHAVTLLNGLLSRPQSPESTMEISRHMDRSLSTLERLFGSVLDFSKLEAASVKPSFGWVALPTLFEQVVAGYRPGAALKGLTLTHGGCDVEIYTDAQLMERVLRNLVENAIKFTKSGSVGLSAGFSGREFMLSVEDSGPGIPANLRGEIFKEYSQASDRKAGDGLGLGLAIVQHLASLLDVAITVRDNMPQGARFELRLPAGRVREAQGVRAAAKPASESVDLAGLTVLCVDDDAASLEALRALLTDWNCRVVLASSPEEAQAKVSAGSGIDAILSDYDLVNGGNNNGADLILALRERLGSVSGVVLTGDVGAMQAHRAGRIEFPVLMKPVSAHELRQLLEVFREMR